MRSAARAALVALLLAPSASADPGRSSEDEGVPQAGLSDSGEDRSRMPDPSLQGPSQQQPGPRDRRGSRRSQDDDSAPEDMVGTLFSAAFNGPISEAKRALKSGVPVDSSSDCSPLWQPALPPKRRRSRPKGR